MQQVIQFIKDRRYNILFYFSGFLTLGFAVNIMKASTLGNGAWDTVTINIRYFFNNILNVEWVTMGMVSFTVSIIIMAIVISYRKKWVYLLMLLPIFLVALSIDFWNLILFKDQYANQFIYQLVFYLIGTAILPLGLALIVRSGFPAFVFDELMLMFVKITKARKITYVRLTIEIIGIAIGSLFGFLTFYHVDGTFGAVNIGSFILTFTISPIMAFYYKILKIPSES